MINVYKHSDKQKKQYDDDENLCVVPWVMFRSGQDDMRARRLASRVIGRVGIHLQLTTCCLKKDFRPHAVILYPVHINMLLMMVETLLQHFLALRHQSLQIFQIWISLSNMEKWRQLLDQKNIYSWKLTQRQKVQTSATWHKSKIQVLISIVLYFVFYASCRKIDLSGHRIHIILKRYHDKAGALQGFNVLTSKIQSADQTCWRMLWNQLARFFEEPHKMALH